MMTYKKTIEFHKSNILYCACKLGSLISIDYIRRPQQMIEETTSCSIHSLPNQNQLIPVLDPSQKECCDGSIPKSLEIYQDFNVGIAHLITP